MNHSLPGPKKPTPAWQTHWRDEADAAFLYRILAEAEDNPQRNQLYLRFAEVEERHMELWRGLLEEQGVSVGVPRPSFRARLLARMSQVFGPSMLLPLLLREEGREVKGYLALHRASDLPAARKITLTLAQESAEHAMALSELTGARREPWHQAGSGGFLNNIVYGFNDGLTANFGLVAGVIGADVDPEIILVTGLAGLIADALSMGSSGYLAAKSEQEVYDHEIAMEKEEIQLMPEAETEELALIYEARGIEPQRAQQMARELMQDPDRALDEMVRDELRIGEAHTTPLKEGWITGTATAIGALIPVAPFFFLQGNAAILTAFTAAMLAHFAIGAARSIFSGRGLLRSGVDMFLVGLGVAGVAYLIGELVSRWLF